jgi:hypothetical protein
VQLVRLDTARAKVLADILRYLESVRCIANAPVVTIAEGIRALKSLRREAYEDLNQIQHEYAALCAIEWLIEQRRVSANVVWHWNPRQTGHGDEPDIRASLGRDILLSGEVTTSPEPKGLIDKRMRETLQKLSQMPGEKVYFVSTEAMRQRAHTKVRKAGHIISVVQLPVAEIATVADPNR